MRPLLAACCLLVAASGDAGVVGQGAIRHGLIGSVDPSGIPGGGAVGGGGLGGSPGGSGGGATIADPCADLSGTCAVWLDGTDIDGAGDGNPADGSNVTAWADKSANGYDFNPSGASNYPTVDGGAVNGADCVEWGGQNPNNNDYLLLTAQTLNTILPNQTWHAFAVAQVDVYVSKATSNVSESPPILFADSAWGFAMRNNTTTGNNSYTAYTRDSASPFTQHVGNVVPTQAFAVQLVEFRHGGSGTATLSVDDGTNQHTTTLTSPTSAWFGSGAGNMFVGRALNTSAYPALDGRICEVILFDDELSVDDAAAVRAYLESKWGL